MLTGKVGIEPGKAQVIHTRREVERGWRAAIGQLSSMGRDRSAAKAKGFLAATEQPQTDRESMAQQLGQGNRRPPGLQKPFGR